MELVSYLVKAEVDDLKFAVMNGECHRCVRVTFVWHLPSGQFWCWLSHSLMHSSQKACSQFGAYSGFSSTPLKLYYILYMIEHIICRIYRYRYKPVPVFFKLNCKVFEMRFYAQRNLFYIWSKPTGIYKDSFSRSPPVLNPAKSGHIPD